MIPVESIEYRVGPSRADVIAAKSLIEASATKRKNQVSSNITYSTNESINADDSVTSTTSSSHSSASFWVKHATPSSPLTSETGHRHDSLSSSFVVRKPQFPSSDLLKSAFASRAMKKDVAESHSKFFVVYYMPNNETDAASAPKQFIRSAFASRPTTTCPPPSSPKSRSQYVSSRHYSSHNDTGILCDDFFRAAFASQVPSVTHVPKVTDLSENDDSSVNTQATPVAKSLTTNNERFEQTSKKLAELADAKVAVKAFIDALHRARQKEIDDAQTISISDDKEHIDTFEEAIDSIHCLRTRTPTMESFLTNSDDEGKENVANPNHSYSQSVALEKDDLSNSFSTTFPPKIIQKNDLNDNHPTLTNGS